MQSPAGRVRPAARPTIGVLVRLTPELKAQIEKIAISQNKYESHVVIEALQQYVARAEKRGAR